MILIIMIVTLQATNLTVVLGTLCRLLRSMLWRFAERNRELETTRG